MEPKKVYITGYGIVSSLGIGVEDNLRALKHQEAGIRLPKLLSTRHNLPVGEVALGNEGFYSLLNLKTTRAISRTSLLALTAVKEAINMAGLEDKHLKTMQLINGTSVGGMDISEKGYADVVNGKKVNYDHSFQGHHCGYSTAQIADYFGIRGSLQTISTACSTSANSIMNAGRFIKAGMANLVIAGGADALSLFTLNGFNALKILDNRPCKPFDIGRKGLNLGEGAAYLVLESQQSADDRKVDPVAELTGYGNANDAYHQTASSPEGGGAALAMQKAIGVLGKSPTYIDYINTHGTGTENNDLSESKAIKKMFKNHIPAYSSTKSYTGHTLAAAGAIEAVFSLLSLKQQLVFPNLNLSEPMDILPAPVRTAMSIKINSVLSNSFGFGGNCTSLIFGKAS